MILCMQGEEGDRFIGVHALCQRDTDNALIDEDGDFASTGGKFWQRQLGT